MGVSPVKITIRFSMSFLHWQPVRRSLSDNGK
jgi:hypothetical protein